MDNQQYGSVITEQGDLGLGVMAIHESENQKKNESKDKDE